MSQPVKQFPKAPEGELCVLGGRFANQLMDRIKRAENITCVMPLYINDSPSGRVIAFMPAAPPPSPVNLAGTLTAGGMYTGNPLTVNISGTLSNTASLGTASLGSVNTSTTLALINVDEIGLNFNGTLVNTHFAPCGGSAWNIVTASPSNGFTSIGGTTYPVQTFNWSVKGRQFDCVLAMTGGSNGTASGTVATFNSFTYSAVINGQTAVSGMVPSWGPLLPGIITAASVGTISVDLNGAITIEKAWEVQPGVVGCG